jgi:hypothetical protein
VPSPAVELKRFRPHLLLALALAMSFAVASMPPIAQPLAYHRFADTRTLLGVPNFWNVLSNLPFLLVGLAGLAWTLRRLAMLERELRAAWLVLFAGVALVGLGSGWYHLDPNNASLVWDRLPMTLAFMAFFAIILGEHVQLRLARLALWPLLVAGVASVLYWRASDDLRPYALVQFLPVLLIPLLLVLYPRRGSGVVWLALACYVLAKLLEHFDSQIHAALGQAISGHSLKHVAAAAGMWALLAGLKSRDSAGVHPGAPVSG